jgi:hypothetical protein
MSRRQTVNTVNKAMIRCVVIPHVEKHVNAKYIRKVFERLNIAKVSNVDIQPNKNESDYNRVVMHIDQWYDNECAYNIIKRIRSSTHEARLMHDEPNWWVLEEKPVNDKKKIKKQEKKIWKKAEETLKKDHYESIINDYMQKKIMDYKQAQENQENAHEWDELSRLINIEVSIM